MSHLKFTPQEIIFMKCAHKLGHQGWQLNKLKSVKKKIKAMKRIAQKETCCYCQRDTTGEYNMVLDIEHILPKSVRLKNIFTIKNLAVSCKRCNMEIKKANTDFLTVPIDELPKRVFRSSLYKFVHPNLEKVESHIKRIAVQSGRTRITKYNFPNQSPKGKYTYEYFRLRELEIDDANLAQGGKGHKKIKDEHIQKAFDVLKQ